MGLRRTTWLAGALLWASSILSGPHALGGGGPENVLLILDPTNQQSLQIGNHYQAAWDIPGRNVVYMDPWSNNYNNLVQFQIEALFGMLANRGIDDHIDFIVIPPGGDFFVSLGGPAGMIDSGGCSAVTRMSLSSAYTLAFIADDILGGTLSVFEANRFFTNSDAPRAFESSTTWLNGLPSASANGRRYFVGFMLGYTGPRGNTPEEILAMIDRGVAVDGDRPAGTFYFMETSDAIRSNPRDPYYPAAVAALQDLGGMGEHLMAFLPLGRHDCLGVMTGVASPGILAADLTLLPGAFCDHLTSFAATFDNGGQTKLSEWIARGASGSMGTVEEPCVFGEGVTGKFPHPRLHLWYYQGMRLGEALLRSIQWAPFQCLFYGDPLTRPFAYVPSVVVPGAPTGEVSGTVNFVPAASTPLPGGQIEQFDLLINGMTHSSVAPGDPMRIDTLSLPDGVHELRVIAYDDTAVRTQGRWLGTLKVNNSGRSAGVSATPATGGVETLYQIEVAATGGDVAEIRLLHNTRVLAATTASSAAFMLPGGKFGAGVSHLAAVAEFTDGRMAVSAPFTITVSAGAPDSPAAAGAAPPIVYGYTADVLTDGPVLIDLPASDPDGDPVTVTIVTPPAQATITPGAHSFLLRPQPSAMGTDFFTFQASDGALLSGLAEVTLRYCSGPTILQAPLPQQVCAGQAATFSVAASGNELTYQWFKGGQLLEGETDAALVIDAAVPADAGSYAVTVTEICAMLTREVRTEDVLLTVVSPVMITGQPEGGTYCPAESVLAFVSDTGAISYQWFKDGVPIPDGTTFFLFIPAATPSDSGVYTVEAGNSCGSDVSVPALISVGGCGLGDADDDNDVDFADFGVFQTCFTTSQGVALSPPCERFDFDGDLDVDLLDFQDYAVLAGSP